MTMKIPTSEIIGNEKSANDGGDSTFEEELADGSSTMYIVIAVIIVFVIGGMATLFFLHYKRKLPPAFYNIGRQRFKPVLGNEEFPVVDDDEKKTSYHCQKWQKTRQREGC